MAETWTEIYAGTCFYLYLHYLLIHSADVHRCLSLPGSSCSGDRGDDCFDLSDLRKYKKGICAMTGTISGVLIAGVFATVFGKITRITGYNIEDIETMVYVSQNSKLQIGGVLFSGILIASLGAVMDVAVSISSTIEEIHNKRPELTAKELFKSGIHVGKDMMGTMSNTLILAFTGGAINTMILIYAYIMPYLQVVNMYSIGIEVIKGISGTLGIVLTVPIVSVISAKVYSGDSGMCK